MRCTAATASKHKDPAQHHHRAHILVTAETEHSHGHTLGISPVPGPQSLRALPPRPLQLCHIHCNTIKHAQLCSVACDSVLRATLLTCGRPKLLQQGLCWAEKEWPLRGLTANCECDCNTTRGACNMERYMSKEVRHKTAPLRHGRQNKHVLAKAAERAKKLRWHHCGMAI